MSVIKAIVETLDSIIVFVKDSLIDDKTMANLTDNDLSIQIASIRLLICWLAHESLLEQELMELMPTLIKFAELVAKSKRHHEVNVFEFLVPGIQRVLIDQEEKFAMRAEALQRVDAVRAEFVDTELKEKIALSKQLLRKCENYIGV